jgi:hypothetical protein
LTFRHCAADSTNSSAFYSKRLSDTQAVTFTLFVLFP